MRVVHPALLLFRPGHILNDLVCIPSRRMQGAGCVPDCDFQPEDEAVEKEREAQDCDLKKEEREAHDHKKKEREDRECHCLKVCTLTPLLTSVLPQPVFPTAGLLTCAPTSFPSLPGSHAALFLLQALTNFLRARERFRCGVDDFVDACEDLPENKERCAHAIHRVAKSKL